MGFEIFTKQKRPSHAGPPKVTVRTAPNGNSNIALSAVVRDWLDPTVPVIPEGGRSYDFPIVMKLVLLWDQETEEFALQRVSDDNSDRNTYKVKGLHRPAYATTNIVSGSAYISDWSLDKALGLIDGRYPVLLTTINGSKAVIGRVVEREDIPKGPTTKSKTRMRVDPADVPVSAASIIIEDDGESGYDEIVNYGVQILDDAADEQDNPDLRMEGPSND